MKNELDKYQWLRTRSDVVEKWKQEQNARTSRIIASMSDDFSASEAKGAEYKNIIEAHQKLFASRWDDNGRMEAVILDLNFSEIDTVMAEETKSGSLKVYSIQPNPIHEDILAMSTLYQESGVFSATIFNNKTKKIITVINGVFFFKWSNYGKRLYYSQQEYQKTTNINYNYVYYYDINTGESTPIYVDKNNAVFIQLEVTQADNLFMQISREYNQIELIYMDTNDYSIMPVNPNAKGNFYFAGIIDNEYYLFTNQGAPNGKVVKLSVSMNYSDAEVIIPEKADAVLQGITVMEKYIVCFYLEGIFNRIRLFDLITKKMIPVVLPSEYGAIEIFPETPLGYTKDTNHLYFNFQGFTVPPTVIRYDLSDNNCHILNAETSDLHENIKILKFDIPSHDGVEVQAYLLFDKRFRKKDYLFPTIMYGYGGFGNVTLPSYYIQEIGMSVLDWVRTGGLYVHCIIRGGGEHGQPWYENGKKLNKKNSFYDFIAIAEWLIAEKWTTNKKLSMVGGSMGGMLVCAVLAMRPDLFNTVIACIPITDMISFANDPRGAMYINEFGDPNKKEDNEYLHSYSPFHQLKKGIKYPNVYIQVGKNDNNALPYHGEIFFQRLLDCSPDSLAVIRILDSGHDYGVGEQYKMCCSEKIAFLLNTLEINNV